MAMDIIQVVEEYVQSEHSDGAILINGAWGIGKSHFLRHKMFPRLEKLKAKNGKNFQCLYVSLNGVKNVAELMDQIVFAKLPWMNKKATKIAAALGGMMVNTLSKIPGISAQTGTHSSDVFKGFKPQDFLTFDQTILCIDDLERLSKSLTPEEFLGFINIHFIETTPVKCIILGNEAEMVADSSYQKIKEKTIARTLQFHSSNVLLKDILLRYKGDRFYDYLLLKSDYIQSIINTYDQRNWRTILFALDMAKNIFARSTTDLYSDPVLGENALLFTFLISFDYKSGKLTANDSWNTEWLSRVNKDAHYDAMRLRLQNQVKKDGESTSTSPEAEFIHRHRLLSIDLFPLVSVYIYLLSGFLDTVQLNEEMLSAITWKTELERKKEQPHYIAFKKLDYYYWENDMRVITSGIEHVLDYAKNGDYQFYEYGKLYQLFVRLEESGLILPSALQQAEALLLEGCKAAMQRNTETYRNLSFLRKDMSPIGHPGLHTLVTDYFDQLTLSSKNAQIESFFSALDMEASDFSSSEYVDSNPFKEITGDQFFTYIKDGNSALLRNLIIFFTNNTRVSNIREFYTEEQAAKLAVLIEHIKQRKDSISDPLLKHHWTVALNTAQSFYAAIKRSD